ncbi:MAG: hypothetical protein M0Z77_02840 [Thermoplasmatales archaeon]|nr:hypothetical protein [Thermoplasmatales archaeon]
MEELIEWMKERPRGRAEIIEVEGDKEIIVVIPTADFDGKYAKKCRENIFKGLHIIFVESGSPKDPYFNYAHNCNNGIKRALEYNPKWIVISNDDMIKVDDVDILKKELMGLPDDVYFAFARQRRQMVVEWSVGKVNLLGRIAFLLTPRGGKLLYLAKILELRQKFDIEYVLVRSKFTMTRWFEILYLKTKESFTNSGFFNVIRSTYIRNLARPLLDETFVNGIEDVDLYLRISRNKIKTADINYRIGNLIGESIGRGIKRSIKEICNETYLNQKMFKNENFQSDHLKKSSPTKEKL